MDEHTCQFGDAAIADGGMGRGISEERHTQHCSGIFNSCASMTSAWNPPASLVNVGRSLQEPKEMLRKTSPGFKMLREKTQKNRRHLSHSCMLENPNVVPFQDVTCFDLQWMFGAQIGKDTSSNFALSFNGLAVRTVDNKWVVPVLDGSTVKLTNVTCLTFGTDALVYRLPVAFESVKAGHLLVRSDAPFSLLFVEKDPDVENRRITGIDPRDGDVVELTVPEHSLDVPSFLVRAVSLLDAFDGDGLAGLGGGDGLGGLLPLLLLSGGLGGGGLGGGGNASNNLLLALALSKGSGGGIGNLGLLLLLSGGNLGGAGLQPLLLASLLSGGKGLFGGKKKSKPKPD